MRVVLVVVVLDVDVSGSAASSPKVLQGAMELLSLTVLAVLQNLLQLGEVQIARFILILISVT